MFGLFGFEIVGENNMKIKLSGGKEDEAYIKMGFKIEAADIVNIDKPELYFKALKSQ